MNPARSLAPDLVLSVFYRDLLPDPVIDAAKVAALNLHPSYLPTYRGRAPLNWVLVNGEPETGITLHHMVRRADAGDLVAQKKVPTAHVKGQARASECCPSRGSSANTRPANPKTMPSA